MLWNCQLWKDGSDKINNLCSSIDRDVMPAEMYVHMFLKARVEAHTIHLQCLGKQSLSSALKALSPPALPLPPSSLCKAFRNATGYEIMAYANTKQCGV